MAQPPPTVSPLFAVLVRATAGPSCEHEAGTVRSVLVVAQADTADVAHNRALVALGKHGWDQAVVQRQSPITVDPDNEPPGYLRNAMSAALEYGVQIVVYDR